jgi:hypothetical protein
VQKLDFVKTFTATAIAGALGVVAATPASAVVYRSVFDPVTFEGTALFDVSEACLDIGTGFASNGYDGCTVDWLEAEVTLKDPLTTLTETFQYQPAHLPSSSAVNSIYVQDGDLAGVSSDIIGAVTVSGSAWAPFNGPWWIQYTFGLPDVLADSVGAQSISPIGGRFGFGEVLLWGCSPPSTTCESPQEVIDTADVEFFRVVPEPATGALAFAALWAAWFGRRRIKRL